MKLIALKPCSFCGKKFFIGDEIPTDHVLDPKAQATMGVLVVVEENSAKADSEDGVPLPPPSSTLEDTEGESEEESTEEEKTVLHYTKNTLSRMTKDELLSAATDLGVEATADMTKTTIVDLIIEKQGE